MAVDMAVPVRDNEAPLASHILAAAHGLMGHFPTIAWASRVPSETLIWRTGLSSLAHGTAQATLTSSPLNIHPSQLCPV